MTIRKALIFKDNPGQVLKVCTQTCPKIVPTGLSSLSGILPHGTANSKPLKLALDAPAKGPHRGPACPVKVHAASEPPRASEPRKGNVNGPEESPDFHFKFDMNPHRECLLLLLVIPVR